MDILAKEFEELFHHVLSWPYVGGTHLHLELTWDLGSTSFTSFDIIIIITISYHYIIVNTITIIIISHHYIIVNIIIIKLIHSYWDTKRLFFEEIISQVSGGDNGVITDEPLLLFLAIIRRDDTSCSLCLNIVASSSGTY